jgi:octaprenyl-diphosphate synthase
LIRLLATANEADASAVRQLLLHPDETTRDQLQPYLDRSDAMKYAHQKALQLAQDARQQLDAVPPSRSRRILAEIAEFAVQRTF